jgi:tetratricopeptide (TPR) repeat protein
MLGRKNAITRLVAVALLVALPILALAAGRESEAQRGGHTLPGLPGSASELLLQSERLTQQAITLFQQGRYAESEPFFQEALALQEQAVGPDDPNIATSLNDLAGLYREQARYGEAELLYQRALALRERALGPNNPAVAQSLNNLAVLFINQGRYGEAEPLLWRALTLKGKASSPPTIRMSQEA